MPPVYTYSQASSACVPSTYTVLPGATVVSAPSSVSVPGVSAPASLAAPPGGSAVLPTAGYGVAMAGTASLATGSITNDIFSMVDRNHDGVISRSEFQGALQSNMISQPGGA